MKKLILFSLLAVFFFSCAVKSHSSSKSGWSDKEKSDYMQECIKNFPASLANSKVKAKDYCSCTLEKIQVKYPKPEDALKMEMNYMMEIAKECLQ